MGRSDGAHRCAAHPLVAALTAADLERAAASMDRAGRAGLLKALAVKPAAARDPRALARLGAARLRTLPAVAAHNVAVAITTALAPSLLEAMGGDGALRSDGAAIGAAEAAVPELSERWSPNLVRLVVVSLWEASGLEDGDRDRLLAAVDRAQEAVPPAAEASLAPGGMAEPAPTVEADLSAGAIPDPDALAEQVLAAEGHEPGCIHRLVLAAARRARTDGTGAPRAAAFELAALDPLDHRAWFVAGFAAGVGLSDPGPERDAAAGPGPPPLAATRSVPPAPAPPASAPPARSVPPAPASPAGATPAPPAPPTDQACALVALGALTDAVERGSAATGAFAAAHPDAVRSLAGRPGAALLTGPVVTAVASSQPDLAAALLDAADAPVAGWAPVVASVAAAARARLDRGEPAPAERLLRAADDALTRWSTAAVDLPDATRLLLEAEGVALTVARIAARRHRRDFAGAGALVDTLESVLVSPAHRADLALERALVAAEVADPRNVVLPRSAAEAAALARRLERARPHLGAALATPSGRVLAGALAVCDADHAAAVEHLTEALRALASELPPPLVSAMRFHRAVAQLCLLEPGTDGAACAELAAAVADGYQPGADHLVLAVDALATHGSTRHGEVLLLATRVEPGSEAVASRVRDAAAAGDRLALDAAEHLARSEVRSLAARFALAEAALSGAARLGDAAGVARLAELADDAVARAVAPDLDERWERLLATNDALRAALEPAHADAARIEALRRTGRLGEARALARSLFLRAAARSLAGFDAADLLGLLEELGEQPAELDELRRLVPSDEPDPGAGATGTTDAPTRAVCVLFVGGDETQARYQGGIDAALAERHGGGISVEWFPSGWGSAWSELADRVEAAYERADALVLLTLMRTMLGRRLRRSAGEAGLPWLACTGHGRASIERAVVRAADLARTAGPGRR